VKLEQGLGLEAFATALIERRGGVVQPQGDGLCAALLTPGLSGEATESLVTLAFDPDQAREAPDALMVTYGSPLLDRWVAEALKKGRTCRLWIRGLRTHPKALPSPSSALSVEGADLRFGDGVPRGFGTTVFSFRVGFHSDEREEERRAIVVDTFYGRVVRQFLERLGRADLAEDPGEALGLDPAERPDAGRLYEVAREELERGLLSDLQVRKLALEARRERELGRISSYFDQSVSELTEELADARDDPEQSQRLLGKIAAVQTERTRQLSQVRAKHDLSVRAGLSSVLEVVQPKVVFPCRIEAPRLPATEFTLVWDPFLETWLAPPCPTCGKPTTRFVVKRLKGLSCPLCEAGVAKAGKPGR